MTALLKLAPADVAAPTSEEPIALLQLNGGDPSGSVAAVYREVRKGRRVVGVVAGAPDAAAGIARALEAVGVPAACPDGCSALLDAAVALLPGPASEGAPLPAGRRPPLRVALAGAGVVGGGVLQRLLDDPRFDVVGVLVRDPDRRRDVPLPPGLALTDPAALLAREPDVVVDAISDASTSLALLRAALARGVHAISAGKQAVGSDPGGLRALAASTGAFLGYSACVGGGAPMIETVRRAAAQGPVIGIEAVLNGTCNFILNGVAAGRNFEDALAGARAAGFAEEDSSSDLDGRDAAAKLAILAHEAGHACSATQLPRDVVSAATATGRLRQVARFDALSGEGQIRLHAVAPGSVFHDLPDEWNAIRVTLEDGRVFDARGRGAGRAPTAESVWADLLDLLDVSRPPTASAA